VTQNLLGIHIKERKKGTIMKKLVTMLLIILSISIGCERKIGKKTPDFELGKGKLISEDAPIEAIQYLELVLSKDSKNIEAQCYLTIAYKRAAVSVQAKAKENEEEYIQGEQREFNKLKNVGVPAAEKLIQIIRAQNRVHKDAIALLVDLGGIAIQPVVETLDQASTFRNNAVNILMQIGKKYPSTIEEFDKAIDSPSISVQTRIELVRILGAIGDTKALPVLQKYLNSPDGGLKTEAMVALYRLGNKEYEGKIIAGLKDTDINVCRAAAHGCTILNSASVDDLIEALNSSDKQVRLLVTQALGKHLDNKAIKPLIKTLKSDSDAEIQNAAANSLIAYGKDVAKLLVEELKKEENWEVRIRITRVLKDDNVIKGIDDVSEYELYEYHKKENHPMVKSEITEILRKLEKK
jgi:HEAT repeat protein